MGLKEKFFLFTFPLSVAAAYFALSGGWLNSGLAVLAIAFIELRLHSPEKKDLFVRQFVSRVSEVICCIGFIPAFPIPVIAAIVALMLYSLVFLAVHFTGKGMPYAVHSKFRALRLGVFGVALVLGPFVAFLPPAALYFSALVCAGLFFKMIRSLG